MGTIHPWMVKNPANTFYLRSLGFVEEHNIIIQEFLPLSRTFQHHLDNE